MNIDIEELYESRSSLEKRYSDIENEIYSSLDSKERVKKLEEEEKLIEEQLTLLDQIIHNLLNTPKLYRKFNKLKEEYRDKYE